VKIVYITPGSGGSFYCENCIRDIELVKALRARGHDAVIVPMYLPLTADGAVIGREGPVFYGAVRIYLEQICPPLRRLPRGLGRVLDSLPVLKLAARMAGSTRAGGLEEMTLSMLRGESGRQSGDLARLEEWLAAEGRPDVVHLSNALLLGLARGVRHAAKAPIVCSLQDEDTWVDTMRTGYREQVWSAMAERARDVDVFAAVSRHYAEAMRDRLELPADSLHVVHLGLDTRAYEPAPVDVQPPAIGYLSRQSEALGLGILAEAFMLLKQDPAFAPLKLRITGGRTGDDTRFLRSLRRRLAACGLLADVDFVDEFERDRRIDFLRSLTLLSVPAVRGEAFGMFQIEAMACGVPVVQPRTGAFPEVVEAAGGGMLYEPNDPPALARALTSLLKDPDRRAELGKRGRQAVLRDFTIERMVDNMLKVYAAALDQAGA